MPPGAGRATFRRVGTVTASQDAEAGAQAWKAARAMSDIQFAPVAEPKIDPPQLPEWLRNFGEWLDRVIAWAMRALGELLAPLARLLPGWSTVQVALLVLAAVGVAWIFVVVVVPLLRRPRAAPAPAGWVPERGAALALLEDADRLAAEGRYGEAAHLLLQRSVHQIATARPDWLSPSSTAREIGALRELPATARTAFGIIAREVERSLFALRGIGQDDWRRAREAYTSFALADLKAAA